MKNKRMDFKLRNATEDDVDYIFSLRQRTMRDQFETTLGWNDHEQRSIAAEHIESANIIMCDRIPLGVVKVEFGPHKIFLYQIQIEPEYQGMGIGSRIISDILRRADSDGLPVLLWVMRAAPAKQIYERMGFSVVEKKEHNCLMRYCPREQKGSLGMQSGDYFSRR